MKYDYVICNHCHWVHFKVSLDYCIKWENDWVTHWNNMDKDGRDAYGLSSGPPKIADDYLNCSRCGGGYKHFRDATSDEIPFGSTIGPILDRNEDYLTKEK